MKMKTVCDQTGLTDRAVRFYIEEGLIDPAFTENYLGRKTYDFSECDVQTLSDITALRQFGFSVAQIREIIRTPEKGSEIVDILRQKKQDIIDQESKTLTVLGRLRGEESYTLSRLAQLLGDSAEENRIPEEDGAGHRKYKSYIQMFVEFLGACVGVALAIALLVLLTDILVYYFSHDVLDLSPEGMSELAHRISPYFFDVAIFSGLAVTAFYYARILWLYSRNDKKPEIMTRAMVIDKKANADSVVLSSFDHRDGGMIWLLIFRTDDGKMLELTVPRDWYYLLDIGTRGQLYYQGTKMIKFTPDNKK